MRSRAVWRKCLFEAGDLIRWREGGFVLVGRVDVVVPRIGDERSYRLTDMRTSSECPWLYLPSICISREMLVRYGARRLTGRERRRMEIKLMAEAL